MIKSFLILLTISISTFASEQIILVVADDFNTSDAQLECFEDGKKVCGAFGVNIGRNGLAWGIGEHKFTPKNEEPLKHEGDGKAPAGVFALTTLFGYTHNTHYKMPYLFASKELICVDDSNSPFYNTLIQAHGDEKSFEFMRREDDQYKLGVVVAHNVQNIKQRGSCIFLHLQKAPHSGTAGCTSMEYKDLKKIISWLDKKKNPILIQIPASRVREVLKTYPQLRSSKFVKTGNI